MSASTFIKVLFLALVCCPSAWAQLGDMQSRMQSMQGKQGSQNAKADEEEKPAEPQYLIKKDNGLAVGIDVSPFIMRAITDENTGFAAVARYGIKDRVWAAAELGFEHCKSNNDNFTYKSNGTFVRLGLDYDIFNNKRFPTNDNIFIGFRYAYAWQSHECENFTITDDYWGGFSGSVGNTSVNSHSLDALFGLRCEVLPHFYMGWSVRCRVLLYSAYDDSLTPFSVAGYGRFENKANLGFTYTLEYQLPNFKKK